MNPDEAMALALDEARLAIEHGDVPIGAIAVVEGAVVGRRHNERERDQDPIAHAEMLLIRDLAMSRRSWRLTDVTLVVTLEPCVMCAGAIVAARIPHLVFGAFDPKAGACGTLYDIPTDTRLNHRVSTISGVREEECADLLSGFFSDIRKASVSRLRSTP